MSKSSSLSSSPVPTSAMRRQPQQQRGKLRLEKILLAAAAVFAEAGVAAATIQQIADRARTAVGSIYQFFPDKLAIFHALLVEHLRQIDALEAKFFASNPYRPLRQTIDEYIGAYIDYFEHPIPRCVVLQYSLQLMPGLFDLVADWPEKLRLSIQRHAHFYRQRNPELSQSKSELLSEVAHNIVQNLVSSAMHSHPPHRQLLYAEVKEVLYGYLHPHIGDHLLSSANSTANFGQSDQVLHNKMMICPNCQSTQISKNGRHKDKQRFICRDCARQFMDAYVERGYPPEIRQQCLDLHRQGISFREIERRTGVSHNTVINWARQE